MQLPTLLSALALLASPAMSSPIADLAARGPHNPTTADVTDFKATRNGTHINYSATIQVNDDGSPPAKFTHATPGHRVPELSSMWDSTDPQLYFRFMRFSSSSGGGDRLRFVLSDVHRTGSTVNMDYFSPVAEWEGRGRVVYTGMEKFVLKV